MVVVVTTIVTPSVRLRKKQNGLILTVYIQKSDYDLSDVSSGVSSTTLLKLRLSHSDISVQTFGEVFFEVLIGLMLSSTVSF